MPVKKGPGGRFCSWEEDGPRPHWDIDNGKGQRIRIDENGKHIPTNDAHKPAPEGEPPDVPLPDWSQWWGSIIAPIINPCVMMPLMPGCPQGLNPSDSSV